MSSENDDAAASNPAKRRRLPRVSNVGGNEDIRNNTDDHSAASSETTYVVRTPGAPVATLIPVTISTPYVRAPNEPNAIKSLKGTKLEPLRALLAPLPEKFTTTIVAQSRAALDLSAKIKQRESSYSRFTERVVVRDEHGKAVTDAESGAPITEQFIPRSIRDKNPVRCSDDVKEDNRIAAVMQRTLARHEKYKSEQATDIQEVSKLEIDIMKERLSTLFLNAAFKYAKVIHIMEKTRRTIDTPLEAPASAHRAVVHVISLLAEEETKTLSTSRSTLLAAYAKQHGINTVELSSHAEDPPTRFVVKILKPILLVSIPHLIKHHHDQDLLREVTATMNQFMEMEEQIEANNDLEEKLDEEDAQELAMEKLVERLATAASEKQLKKFKGILRKKYTAGEKSHTSAGKNNGQKKQGNGKEKRDGKSKKKSKKQSDKPARNSRDPPPPPSNNRRDRSRSNSRVRFSDKDELKAERDNNNRHRNNPRTSSANDRHSSNRNNNDRSATSRPRGRDNRQNSRQNSRNNDRSRSRRRDPSYSPSPSPERRDRRRRSRSPPPRGGRGGRGGGNNGKNGRDKRRR